MEHVSDQVVAYKKTTEETEKNERKKFPFQVIQSIYDKYGQQQYIETRGRKRKLKDVDVEEKEKKKAKLLQS